ncbi:MAG TPA: transcriptional repressor [Casimicrobiaceae bacterium]|nr:transcriptional repressor [Casimicrobiaceae bacterium]
MSGERDTRQRRAILGAIRSARRPLSPQEILAAASALVPGLGTATVYRTVKLLLEEGGIAAVAVAGESPRYEVAHSDHHHHFQCTACRRVFDMKGCPGDLHRLAPRGFRVDAHDLTLYGRCSDCGRRGADARR